jgi:hypothetical protein
MLAVNGAAPRISPGAHVRWPVLGDPERLAVLRVFERGVLSGPPAPEVRGLLRSSVLLVSQRYPIVAQPVSVCEAYAAAFEAVWRSLGDVLQRAERAQ